MALLDDRSPKSIEDCVKEDSISSQLWAWSERIEKWGKFLFYAILIFGLIVSIVESWQGATDLAFHDEVDIGLFFKLFFIEAIAYAFYAFIEYLAYQTLSVLIGALAGIYENTRKTALLTELRMRNEKSSSGSAPTANPGKQ